MDGLKFDLSSAVPGAFGRMVDVRVDLWGRAVKIELRREEAGVGRAVRARARA